MIIDRDIDTPQSHREEIGAQGVTRPIIMLEELKVPLSLSG